MVFSSITFLFYFLPALLLLYYLTPRRLRSVRNFILLAFSLVFYGFGGPKFLLLMLCSVTVNYVCGLLAGCEKPRAFRRAFMWLAVILGIGALGYFKYLGFFSEMLRSLGAAVPAVKIVLPIGISFFTFQGISYVIDVYRGDAPVQKNPLSVALYIALFPQLVAGPIVRYTTVADELTGRRESVGMMADGIVRFAFGLAKKMLLANAMGEVADAIFGLSGSVALPTAWVGALAYTAQIYFDFSAYSDMAIGLGMLFGFSFPENFDHPYTAVSITDFWRRWHITLSTWFRDYVYIPLGGNRCSVPRNIFNLFVVWGLTGFWHGAAWNFILWGLYFFVFLVLEKYVYGKALQRLPRFFRHLYTMLLVVLSWVLFRAESLPAAVTYFGSMFGAGGTACDQAVYYLLEYWPEFVFCVIASLPVGAWLKTCLTRKKSHVSAALLTVVPKLTAALLFALSYLKLVNGSFNPFIYFRF